MAAVLRHVLRVSPSISSQKAFALNKWRQQCIYVGFRSLFSNEILGLENFKTHRELVGEKLGDLKSKFPDRMREYVAANKECIIYTDDLKSMVYITENDNDIDILDTMIKKYHEQSGRSTFSTFVFGPIILRMFHFLNKTEKALELFKDTTLGNFLKQTTSYVIMMDMLYEERRYEDVVELFELYIHDMPPDYQYPVDAMTITLAALYRMNNQGSYARMVQVIEATVKMNSKLSMRSCLFAAMLAINQGEPSSALEMLSQQPRGDIGVLANVKILAYSRLNRPEDCIPLLKMQLQQENEDQPSFMSYRRSTTFQDVLHDVQNTITKADKQELLQQFTAIEQELNNAGVVYNISLEEFISQTIYRKRSETSSYRGRQRSSVSRRYGTDNYGSSQPPQKFYLENE